MLDLLIPSIGLSIAVQQGVVWGDWDAHYREANTILSESAYQYPDRMVIGAHSDAPPFLFDDLDEVSYNDLIIFQETRYRAREIFIVDEQDTSILNSDDLILFTCSDDDRRLVITAKSNRSLLSSPTSYAER